VWRAEALGWNLTAWTCDLLNGHWERHAARMGKIDRHMWGSTLDLRKVDRVTRAVKATSNWDAAIVTSGLLDFLAELEHEGRLNDRLADRVAGWRDQVEGARDAMAGAVVELLAVTVVANGGGRRTTSPAEAAPGLT
jgi:hypothetical protein